MFHIRFSVRADGDILALPAGCGTWAKDSDEEARPSPYVPPRGQREIKPEGRPRREESAEFGVRLRTCESEREVEDCRGHAQSLFQKPN